MQLTKKNLFALFFIFFLIVPFSVSASEKVFYLSKSKEKEGIQSLRQHADQIDILAPQFYEVSKKLVLTGSLDANLKKEIHAQKVRVMPLVINAGFKQDTMHKLLLSKAAQDRVIKSMVSEAKKETYIGWQFDFENISYRDKDLYSAFVERASIAMKKNNLLFSVAVVPRIVDSEDTDDFNNWAGVYDYARIAKASDFVSLMTYGDPHSLGPVASVPYINSVLAYLNGAIPKEKLSLGVPLYYWGWTVDPYKKVVIAGSHDKLLSILATTEHTQGFDESLGVPWAVYTSKNKQYKAWYQNKESLERELSIIDTNNFRGLSAWVLGTENPEIWNTIALHQKSKESILAEKFELLSLDQASTFGEMYILAKDIGQRTGTRPAFLLAISQEELALEKNDMCYLTDFKTGAGTRIPSGKSVAKVMKPDRDIAGFLAITKALGKDPLKTPVTCPMAFGWGGAMGPADFIPSTWMLYKDKIEQATGKPSDPWNVHDAFLAAGMYLADSGVKSQTRQGEFDAAMIYFSGSATSPHTFYATGAMALADKFDGYIKTIEGK